MPRDSIFISVSYLDGKSTLAAPYQPPLGEILAPGYTGCSSSALGHAAAIWAASLPSACVSRRAVPHQNCRGHILAHQSSELKMLTQKYTDGYRHKTETLQNICGTCSKLCHTDPFLLGRACKSPQGDPDYTVLVGGDAIKA